MVKKVQDLIDALKNCGVKVKVDERAYGTCLDGKSHGYGISITWFYDYDEVELLFSQEGKLLDSYMELPIRKK